METKDIYTAAGGVTGGNMETKSVPGYVPAPVVSPDFVAPETTEEQDGGAADGATTEGGSEKSSDGKAATKGSSKTTTQK